MSCDWRFECADCRTSYSTERNHGEGPMAAILAARPALAHLAAELKAQANLIGDLEDFLDDPLNIHPLLGLAAWFAAHDGHRVKLIDETDREYGTCGARVSCSGGCSCARYCALEPGHPGDHDPSVQTSARGP